jgi:hypothetical protein
LTFKNVDNNTIGEYVLFNITLTLALTVTDTVDSFSLTCESDMSPQYRTDLKASIDNTPAVNNHLLLPTFTSVGFLGTEVSAPYNEVNS